MSENGLPDRKNPYYVKGMRLREKKQFDEARHAFEKCLRLNPDSRHAHLQLGMLHEDVFADPAQAIYHYRAYLAREPEGSSADAVRAWLVRTEKAQLRALLERYPQPPAVMASPAATTRQPATLPTSVVTPREKALAARIKALDAELDRLRRLLAEPNATPGAAERHAPPNQIHVVVAGDTLYAIARKYYGDVRYWPRLRDYNREVLRAGNVLARGMRLRIPPVEQLESARTEQ